LNKKARAKRCNTKLLRNGGIMSHNSSAICLVLIVSVVMVIGCLDSADQPGVYGVYFGQEPPGDTAELFAPGILSTGMHKDCGPAFSPDGNEVYFRIAQAPHSIIAYMTRENDVWSEPEIVSFSGQYSDGRPALSADGRSIYFSSNRPSDNSGENKEDEDIWVVNRAGPGWGDPILLDSTINSPVSDWGVAIAANGTLYYTHTVTTANSTEFRILRSPLVNGQHVTPEDLGDIINRHGAASPCIVPDESFIVFASMGHPENKGVSDLYVSYRDPDGCWSNPVSLGDNINSAGFDYFPSLSPDGKYLFFVSTRSREWSASSRQRTFDEMKRMYTGPGNGRNDIYWVDARIIERLRLPFWSK
jgi:hypothetical protein